MKLTGLIFQMDIYVDGNRCARKLMNITWMDEKKWHRLRSKRPTECHDTTAYRRPASKAVGRQLPLNVVISNVELHEQVCTTTIVVDQNHPSIFDHPLDHVPGMLLIEAYRQTALVSMSHYFDMQNEDLIISRYKINFSNFCEFNLPAICHINVENIITAKEKNDTVIPMTILQGEKTISQAEITVTRK